MQVTNHFRAAFITKTAKLSPRPVLHIVKMRLRIKVQGVKQSYAGSYRTRCKGRWRPRASKGGGRRTDRDLWKAFRLLAPRVEPPFQRKGHIVSCMHRVRRTPPVRYRKFPDHGSVLFSTLGGFRKLTTAVEIPCPVFHQNVLPGASSKRLRTQFFFKPF
jgi:hypothetical protein